MTATEKDRDILARTLWGEARGEGLAGQIAVAWTIRNRVNDGRTKSWWGEGYAGVCQARYQFSCWNKNDPNFPFLSGAKPIPAGQFAQALCAADQVIAGAVPDPTGGATHYYATTMAKAPAWAAKAKQTVRIGQHVFFKDVP
ncbi:cell wall hydrolase [Pseudomonas chlororaphis]|uniref:cell wall hydrolase n=1 Tax=Pseudomonas chlororaphis TaxID=587753 RepID=UPI00236877A9|nr:cell wall hydrolase [Pseudomonas chlororaphis]WDG79134.1 cell wall hydrolase [Pseudomonas chlororaphis]WDG87814.1 cell wall hydrolase [Pseudomonas chlororaphis]